MCQSVSLLGYIEQKRKERIVTSRERILKALNSPQIESFSNAVINTLYAVGGGAEIIIDSIGKGFSVLGGALSTVADFISNIVVIIDGLMNQLPPYNPPSKENIISIVDEKSKYWLITITASSDGRYKLTDIEFNISDEENNKIYEFTI